jgi:hypothetical protein
LYEHPPTNELDIEFLITEEAKFLKNLQDAVSEKRPSAAAATGSLDSDDDDNDNNGKTPAWHGFLPWLRLYCWMTLDDIKQEMTRQFCMMDREELSARNSDLRPLMYLELVADKFNDPDLVFHMECIPELHEQFTELIALRFQDMPGKATAEQIKKKIAAARANLAEVKQWETFHIKHHLATDSFFLFQSFLFRSFACTHT